MPTIKSVLKPENSIIAGAAVVGLVCGVYQLDVGPVSSVAATPANDGNAMSSINKAGYTSLIMVAGIALLARDPNIVILGGAAIIAFHAHYLHAGMSDNQTGQIVPPGPKAYQNASTSTPPSLQAVA
jgi:hypothetical protein